MVPNSPSKFHMSAVGYILLGYEYENVVNQVGYLTISKILQNFLLVTCKKQNKSQDSCLPKMEWHYINSKLQASWITSYLFGLSITLKIYILMQMSHLFYKLKLTHHTKLFLWRRFVHRMTRTDSSLLYYGLPTLRRDITWITSSSIEVFISKIQDILFLGAVNP